MRKLFVMIAITMGLGVCGASSAIQYKDIAVVALMQSDTSVTEKAIRDEKVVDGFLHIQGIPMDDVPVYPLADG